MLEGVVRIHGLNKTRANGPTHVLVLDIPAWLTLQLGHVLGFAGEVLDEHLLRAGSATASTEWIIGKKKGD